MPDPYVQKTWSGGAQSTRLNAAISAGDGSIIVQDGSSMPVTGPFVLSIDHGQSSEEKVLASQRTGNVIDVAVRGYDDTTAQAHGQGAVIAHVLDANTVRQANELANIAQGAAGVLPVGNPNHTWSRLVAPTGPTGAHHHLVSDPAAVLKMKWEGAKFFSVRKSSAQAIGANVFVPVTFPLEEFDSLGGHEAASATVTLNRAGLWLLNYTLGIPTPPSPCYVHAELQVNNTGVLAGGVLEGAPLSRQRSITGSALYYAATGTDYVRLIVASNVAIDIGSTDPNLVTFLQGVYLGGV